MLLIGDIHITSKRKDRILKNIRDYIFSQDDENIVFMGDFVYHFNYDRKALMGVFELFIECYEAGKSVYILAGNHDWLAGHFVYEEAKRAFSYIQKASVGLYFITKPEFHTIANQECLFYPYHIPDQSIAITDAFKDLAASSNMKEQRSARANSELFTMIEVWREKKKSKKLRVFHHRYIVGVSFPGQFSKFAYKNPGLSKELLDIEDISMFSGHLHQSFFHKNYLCTGSVRHTSPLEINQTKYLFHIDEETEKVTASPVFTNPYIKIELEDDQKITLEKTTSAIKEFQELSKVPFAECDIIFDDESGTIPALVDCTLTLQTTKSYDQIDTFLDSDVFASFQDVRLSQTKRQLPEMVELLDTESKQLGVRISDWKSLLKSYLEKKYGTESDRYLEELQDMDVM